MYKKKIAILNTEYKVNVYIGTQEELFDAALKYLGKKADKEWLKENILNNRGLSFNLFKDLQKSPLILVDGDLPHYVVMATLAHEASHAISYIEERLGIDDRSDEFRGHGIGAIMRAVLKDILKDKFKK